MKRRKSAPIPRRDQMFLRAWQAAGGNVAKTAESLGITRQAVYNRLPDFPANVFYILPVDEKAFQAVGVNYSLRRIWVATGRMSFAAAQQFQRNKEQASVGYDSRGLACSRLAVRCVFLEDLPKSKKGDAKK